MVSGGLSMKYVSICGGTLCLLLGLTAGCGKAPQSNTPATGLATQGASPEASSTYADANLAELTRSLRRWIVANKEKPANFDDFATKAKITVPTPPAGKKYALSSEMRVVLVDR